MLAKSTVYLGRSLSKRQADFVSPVSMAYPAAKHTATGRVSKDYRFDSNLRDGTRVVLRRLDLETDQSLVAAMCELLNYEVESGDSYPIDSALSVPEFISYFASYDTFVLVACENADDRPAEPNTKLFSDRSLVGCFYVKPNWPGRCSHVCNGGFLVAPEYRRLGAAFIMGERYRHLAKDLGYSSSMFNLVFESNIGSNLLWLRLGFTNSGRVLAAGRLKLHGNREALEHDVREFRRRMLTTCGPARAPYCSEEWISSPVFDDAGVPPELLNKEAYVSALQWQLDLRCDLEHFKAPWIESASKLQPQSSFADA